MLRVHRAEERYEGGDLATGIRTRHAFSFSGHYDPANTGFGLLVACNEEYLEPGAGFAEHAHHELDIVTWVIEGDLTHEDSTGRATTVRAGDLQRLSAGSGVRHTERNDGPEPLRFLQMWLVPAAFGAPAEYEVVRGLADSTPYALPRTDAVLHVRRPGKREDAVLPRARWRYLHVVSGELELRAAGSDGQPEEAGPSVLLAPGDAARVSSEEGEPVDELLAVTRGPAEYVVWEMHAEPSYG